MLWYLKMAWRDSRRSRGRLVLFISSIAIGIAALVAINSFSENLQNDIQREAKNLLGADLVVQGGQPAGDSVLLVFEQIGYEAKATVQSLISMVFFPKNGGTRLVQVRALEGRFPFYGAFSTEPPAAAAAFINATEEKQGATTAGFQVALVEKSLMIQFGLRPGDTIRVGTLPLLIIGQLNSAPGRAAIAGSIAPVVYIPQELLGSTGLAQRGSLIWYQYFFKFPENTQLEEVVNKRLKPGIGQAPLQIETVTDRREDLGQAFGNMQTFLNLVGFIALLLGCIGVSGSVYIYIKDKLTSIAVLRCIGMKGWQAFRIFLLQVIAFGTLGSLAGALAGAFLQKLLPLIMGDFLPLENISTSVSSTAIFSGVITGLIITVLFALLPLLSIRRISPLRSLRAAYEEDISRPDPLRWLVYLGILAFITGFTLVQTRDWMSLVFPLGIVVAFLSLAGVGKLLVWAMHRFFPVQWSYIWRQAIANLYRPNNQTLLLVVTIGLGTALISTLFLVQDLLLKQVAYSGSGDVPNMIVFDVQPRQKDAVANLIRQQGLPVKQIVPIVTIRLESIDGITKEISRKLEEQKQKETASSFRKNARDSYDDARSDWVYDREYRVTYRDTLIDTEKILEGEWHKTVGPDGVVYVSIDDNLAKAMKAKVGTRLIFNVQGVRLETVVGSIRDVDFRRVQTNFLVLFPKGVLEDAPQFYVVLSKVESEEESARFQQALAKNFPNVSVIDLTQILKSAKTVLDKISFVIRFMALFSILTGIIVLISSLVLSRFQRVQESVLLRTLGARKRQVLWINLLEYFIVGALAALTGTGLSFAAAFLLAVFALDIPFQPDIWPPFFIFMAISLLTVLIGLLNSREVVEKPPLEVLRNEL